MKIEKKIDIEIYEKIKKKFFKLKKNWKDIFKTTF